MLAIFVSFLGCIIGRPIAGVICLVLTTCAWSGDLIVERALLEDPSGALRIDDVVEADFRPVGAVISRGYTDSALWLRIRVNTSSKPGALELRIRPAQLDEILLYEPDPTAPRAWKNRVTGDRHGYSERDRTAMTLGFVVRPQAPETTYYLRLKTTSSAVFNVEALAPQEALIKDVRLLLWHAVYLGVMLWLLTWSVHDYASYHQPLTLWFVIHEIDYVLYTLVINGYLAPLMPAAHPEWADLITSVVIMSILLFAVPFTHVLFRLYGTPRWLLWTMDVSILVVPAGFVLFAVGQFRLALQLNALCILWVSICLPFLAWGARSEAVPSRRVLRLTIAVQTVTLLVTLAPLLGWVEAVEINLDLMLVHGLLSALLMFRILSLRSRQMFRERQQDRLELALAEQQLKLERAQLTEQSRFMAMLVHELKTPISVMRMTFGLEQASVGAKRHAQRALHDMNAIVERCRQTDQIEQTQWTLHCERCALPSLVEESIRSSEMPHRFVVEAAPVPYVDSDPQLLRVILGNLLDNALKYSAPETEILVRLDAPEDDGQFSLRIVVENQPGAAGLPDPDNLFGKYYRSPRAHQQTGSGLGLYLVRGFAELLGGRIEYGAVAGNARFTLWIPG